MEVSSEKRGRSRDLGFKVHDYVRFSAIVETDRRWLKSKTGTGDKEVQVIHPISGTGIVLSINKNRTNCIRPDVKRGDAYKPRPVSIAHIDAGPVLGIVRAVIDDATIVAEQLAFA